MADSWMMELGLEKPVIQAGMGGGVAGPNLAAATSMAGGLGTLGLDAPAAFRAGMRQIREKCGARPFAVNLLMPFLRQAHVAACLAEKPAVAVLFLGGNATLVKQLHGAGIKVWQQVGNVQQAEQALGIGVDGLIAQGNEAGGHQAGNVPLASLLPGLRARLEDFQPLLAAGGIHDGATAQAARELGADGVVAGTRFLLTEECEAHRDYKQRLLAAEKTLRTKLFGLGWPAWHRVATNAATERWAGSRQAGPVWVEAAQAAFVPLRRFLPLTSGPTFVGLQRLAIPLFSPFPVLQGMDAGQIDTTPLYAGKAVAAMQEVKTVAQVVSDLTP